MQKSDTDIYEVSQGREFKMLSFFQASGNRPERISPSSKKRNKKMIAKKRAARIKPTAPDLPEQLF